MSIQRNWISGMSQSMRQRERGGDASDGPCLSCFPAVLIPFLLKMPVVCPHPRSISVLQACKPSHSHFYVASFFIAFDAPLTHSPQCGHLPQVANDVLVKHPYNKEHDQERKRGIEMMQQRSRAELDTENAVSMDMQAHE